MKLSEIFEHLTHGELAISSLSNEGAGIQPDQYPKVISSINLGLTDLFKRFPLKTSYVNIKLHSQVNTYYLHKDFALSNGSSTELIKYILDTCNPFQNNVLRIEEVKDQCGNVLYLNDDTECDNVVYTPDYNSVQVPCETKKSVSCMSVIYRAAHPAISMSTAIDPDDIEVGIPNGHLQALLYFVAARLLVSTPGLDGVNTGDVFMAKYEAECLRIENQNLMQKDNPQNLKLIAGGWL